MHKVQIVCIGVSIKVRQSYMHARVTDETKYRFIMIKCVQVFWGQIQVHKDIVKERQHP